MTIAVLIALALAAEPTAEQVELLKAFRTEFVRISPGEGVFPKSFSMGMNDGSKEEAPAHEVTIAHPFSIGKYEVPQNLWEAVMGSNPSKWKGDRNSVEMLSFDEAEEFCKKATLLMQAARLIESDEVIRLPSEAEWEYATRAGSATRYSFGDDIAQLTNYAWYTDNAAGNDPPVGAKQPNPGGLYDVHGYLSEWCLDVWHSNYQGAPADGSAWQSGGEKTRRVLRSGSWRDTAEKLRSTARRSAPVETRSDDIGLRCVLSKSH